MKFKDFFPLRLSKLSQFFRKRVRSLKSLYSFNFIKRDEEDWKLYTLSRTQLKNLIDKNIHFHFFQLEDFSIVYEKEAALLLKKAKRVEKGKLVLELRDQDRQQPIVLICEGALISKQVFQELRQKGFINVYFIDGGLKKLMETEVGI